MESKGLILIALSLAMVMACVGVGYASEYSASTENTNNSLQSTFMLLKLNDNAIQQGGTATANGSFVFTDLVYHRDMVVTSTASPDISYTSVTGTSNVVKFRIEHTPSGVNPTTVTARLNEAHSEATITLRFYSDQACTTTIGNPITMTAMDQVLPNMNTDTDYWCKATIVISDSTLNSVNDRTEILTNDGSGTITFGVTFTATAQS